MVTRQVREHTEADRYHLRGQGLSGSQHHLTHMVVGGWGVGGAHSTHLNGRMGEQAMQHPAFKNAALFPFPPSTTSPFPSFMHARTGYRTPPPPPPPTPKPIFPLFSHPSPLPNLILYCGRPCALVKLMGIVLPTRSPWACTCARYLTWTIMSHTSSMKNRTVRNPLGPLLVPVPGPTSDSTS